MFPDEINEILAKPTCSVDEFRKLFGLSKIRHTRR